MTKNEDLEKLYRGDGNTENPDEMVEGNFKPCISLNALTLEDTRPCGPTF